jgi:dipeptidyl aminopeptidase/acylaminoacyl peptidase
MTRLWLVLALAAFAAPGPEAQAQAPPATEIYLAPFTEGEARTTQIGIVAISRLGVSVGKPINITNNPGYDNQPFFLPDSSGLLFSSNRDGKQNDIYRYDIATKTITQLTHTPENEYSPTIMPDGRTFSTVRGDEQRLWKFNLDGSDAGLAYAHAGKIGYHVWISPDRLAVFVLGAQNTDPSTLQLVDLRTGAAEIVESSIGRSLHVRPGHGTVSFVHKPRGATLWEIKELNPDTRKILPLTDTVEGSEDLTWTPKGVMVMGSKAKLYMWLENEDRWAEIGDLGSSGVKAITRLAISPDGKWIAIVSTPPAK